MKWAFLLTIAFVGCLFPLNVDAQGCVAIRHFSSANADGLNGVMMSPGDITLRSSYRYFKSFRHFRGSEEEPDRVVNNTEVINHTHALDLSLTYAITHQMYATFTLPFVVNSRSSLYEHGRDERNTTFSRGLADARVGLGYWLLNPETHSNVNVALGLGVKVPTGNQNATDIFYNVGVEGHPEVRPVDQSIQPGDGGFGFTADFQGFVRLTDNLSAYGSGFYLFSPRETNGVHTFRETLSPILENESIMSVTDQYSFRAGGAYALPIEGVSLSLGAQYEGVPVEDLIGGSEGFRRPGSVFAVEPGISYMAEDVSLNFSVPIAMYRNRPQSITDMEIQQMTGNPRNGDAAFADYLISAGISYRIRGRRPPVVESYDPDRVIELDSSEH
ncbi:MAG: hypothetical protein R3284_08350 [Rubricoccaceae bacterium]|nr:hypothetical protein [Rubricoccaceae bacterium]